MGNEASGDAGRRDDPSQRARGRRPRAQVLYQDIPATFRVQKHHHGKKSVAHRRMLTVALRKNCFFETMEADELDAVIDAFHKQSCPAPGVLVSEGQTGDSFYVVLDGSLKYAWQGGELGEYRAGDCFGELALAHTTVRAYTVTSHTDPCNVWVLKRDAFRSTLALHHANKRAHFMRWFAKVPMLRALKEAELLRLAGSVRAATYSAGQRVVKKGAPLRTFYMVQSGLISESMAAGGLEHGPGSFFNEEALLNTRDDRTNDQGEGAGGGTEQGGGGDVGAEKKPRMVSSDKVAREASELLCLDLDVFESLLGPYTKVLESHFNVAVLAKVPCLATMTPPELRRLDRLLEAVEYGPDEAGKRLVQQGQPLSKLVLVARGSCEMVGAGVAGPDPRPLEAPLQGPPWDPNTRTLEAGDFFGQLALLSDEKVAYSVRSGEEGCRIMELSRQGLTKIFGPLHHLIVQREHTSPEGAPEEEKETHQNKGSPLGGRGGRRSPALSDGGSGSGGGGGGGGLENGGGNNGLEGGGGGGGGGEKVEHWTYRSAPSLAFEDLRAKALLRSGTFGDTRLVVHKPSGGVYALKSFSRTQLERLGATPLPFRERAALLAVGKHPFVVDLVNTYKNANKLYMLTEHAVGGELYHLIHRPPPLPPPSSSGGGGGGGSGGLVAAPKLGLEEKAALFYAACITEALMFLHTREVVYRNLCPEAILIDVEGYPRLTDLETAKFLPQGEMAHTLCGSVEYLAPEMLLGRGHHESVDWWALGVLCYEMLTAKTPFEDFPDRREDHIIKKIIRQQLVIVPSIPPRAGDLIAKLLVADPSKRIGCQRAGAIDVQEHEWFVASQVDFPAIATLTATPPFVPSVRSRADFSAFPAALPTQ